MAPRDRVTPVLAAVPETMLWALHNRAIEARRHDSVLVDPESVRIHDAIDYDFTRHFGDPAGSLAARAAGIDRTLRRWLEAHPDGTVVSLGEGLETQSRRVDNGRMQWLSVDLPDAISLRERFLPPTRRFRHIAASALDPVWMAAIDPASDVFIVAQGLLMYLQPSQVARLFTDLADRFPGVEIAFDCVPRWFSRLTLSGLNQTPYYCLPPMPWGIDRNEVETVLRRWHPRVADVSFLDYRGPRGLSRFLAGVAKHVPVARHGVPSLVHVSISSAACQPATTPNAATKTGPMAPRPNEPGSRPRHLSAIGGHQLITPNKDAPGSKQTGATTVIDVMAVATRNARTRNDIATVATQVITKRVALGMAAAVNPLHADHVEFARMVPEKMQAFSAAGTIMLKQMGLANRQIMSLMSNEVTTASGAAVAMIGCSGPLSVAAFQVKLTRAWFDRATSSAIAMGMLALTGQAATMDPIRETVFDNADRLGR